MTNMAENMLGGGGADQTALAKGLGESMSSGSGGITGLLEKFDAAGLGDKARSWVGDSGQKQPVSGDEVRKALGDQQVNQIAAKAHLQPQEASDKLASILPDTVSRLTPGGKIPDAAELQRMLEDIPGL
jgi:uncharacterized protein YidB (DUF937 family)